MNEVAVTESETQLLNVIRNYREKNEKLVLSLKAIAAMDCSSKTDKAQLAALCIAIAKTTLEVVG